MIVVKLLMYSINFVSVASKIKEPVTNSNFEKIGSFLL